MSQVFISYRQTNNVASSLVRALGERLRSLGIDVQLDQFFLDANPGGPNEGWDKWSSDQALGARRVLIVGSQEWFQCFNKSQPPGTGLGAACEADDLRHRIYEAAGVIDDIRIVLFKDTDASFIPGKLKRYHYFHAFEDVENIVRWIKFDTGDESTIFVSKPSVPNYDIRSATPEDKQAHPELIGKYLTKEVTEKYAQTLINDLLALKDDFPFVWCPIGFSGDKLFCEIAKILPPDLQKKIQVLPLTLNIQDGSIHTIPEADDTEVSGQSILLLDSHIHSGQSILAAARFIGAKSPKAVIIYSMIVDKSALFIPHMFSILTGYDQDRPLLHFDTVQNNRLFAKGIKPFGIFRKIEQADAINYGIDFLDKITLGDLYYQHRAYGLEVILVEDRTRIIGVLGYNIRVEVIFVDCIVVDKNFHGVGLGGALLRCAEYIGRAHQCKNLEIWATDLQTNSYQNFGFNRTGQTMILDGENNNLLHLKL